MKKQTELAESILADYESIADLSAIKAASTEALKRLVNDARDLAQQLLEPAETLRDPHQQALQGLSEKVFSRTGARLMLHSALLIKEDRPELDSEKIINTVMELHELAIERGQEAARKSTSGR